MSRLKQQLALQQDKKRMAAAVAAAALNPVKDEQSLDPNFSPSGSDQFGNPEAEDRASGAAQMAYQMSQVKVYILLSYLIDPSHKIKPISLITVVGYCPLNSVEISMSVVQT